MGVIAHTLHLKGVDPIAFCPLQSETTTSKQVYIQNLRTQYVESLHDGEAVIINRLKIGHKQAVFTASSLKDLFKRPQLNNHQ